MDNWNSWGNPPAQYRSAPLWVWNDLMREEQIAFHLNELKGHGFGGAFVHPRPGLITEYLSEEWFSKWSFALETAKALDMKLYIYDENSYPSGFAGGLVSSRLPDCLATGMSHAVIRAGEDGGAEELRRFLQDRPPVAVFACKAPNEGESFAVTEELTLYPKTQWAARAEWLFVIKLVEPVRTGWLAGFGFVDLLRPEVTEEFVRTTHEAYFSRFGEDFGGAIPALFTDEPYVSAGEVYSSSAKAVPFSFWFVNEFEKLHGYSLLRNLPCVFRNVEGAMFDYPAEKVRYDYYKTIRTLWVKNNIEPISKWCAEHHINWTGHYLEHQWPHCASNTSPSMQSNYEYHDWPAIDMLLSNYLRDRETHSLAMTIHEIRSAANQFGKERTLCELYGAGGWDSTFEDYKRMGDWVLVNGINFINQHLSYSSYAGARKRDHPQSFDWRQPWWNQYTFLNDYIGRVSYMLSQGRMNQRILVLNPSTTGYLVPPEEEVGDLFSGGGTDEIKNPDMTSFLALSQILADGQWDFDYGDEFTLARHAEVLDGKLKVVQQVYDVVLVSGDMRTMLSSTAALLDKYADRGGKILAVGSPGPLIEGLEDCTMYQELSLKWAEISLSDVQDQLSSLLENRIKSDKPFASGFTHMRRELTDGETVYFFVNHSFQSCEATLTLAGKSVRQLNLFSGEEVPIAFVEKQGVVDVPIRLARNQSLMIVVGEAAADVSVPSAVIPEAPQIPVPLQLRQIYREERNVLLLEYCDLRIGGREYSDIKAQTACELVFAERGFQKNPWDNQVQFHNNVMDKNCFYGEDSGFSAVYHFRVAEELRPASLLVTAEQAALCQIRVNGVEVPWIPGEFYLDENFGVAEAAPFLRSGLNEIEVVVDRFDVRMEVEPVYLRGDFDVIAKNGVWVLCPPSVSGEKMSGESYGSAVLLTEPWKTTGMPFYPYSVCYVYEAILESVPERVLLEIAEYEASAISALVNGAEILLHVDGRRPANIARLLKCGENEIVIRVCGTLKNLLGPHFPEKIIRGSAWPDMWRQAPYHEPSAECCDLLPYGLFVNPVLMK